MPLHRVPVSHFGAFWIEEMGEPHLAYDGQTPVYYDSAREVVDL